MLWHLYPSDNRQFSLICLYDFSYRNYSKTDFTCHQKHYHFNAWKQKRTADTYTRTVLLSQSCLNNCWIVWRSLLISRGFVINAVKPADSLSFLASSVTHAVVAMIGTDRESLLRELLGNWVTRASELRRDTAFFQGASMTPLLFAL